MHAAWRYLLFGLLVGGSAFASAADRAHWQSVDYLVDAFVEIALRSEYSPKPSTVRKWITPVNYFIVHQVADEDLHQRLIRTHFEQLAEITGLTIRPAESQAAANYLIVMTSEDLLKEDMQTYLGWRSTARREKFFRESVCLSTFSIKPKGPIFRAVVIIPVDRARARRKLVACVVEELTQVMGLANDSVKVFPSVFNDLSTDVFLSGLDSLLLKMLYDPRVKAGMDEDAVRPILQQIATEFERDDRFATAEKAAAEGGLSALSP